MASDRRHLLGGVLMWGGVAAALIGVMGPADGTSTWGMWVFSAGVVMTAVGAVIKKRTCPHCRGARGSCALPPGGGAGK
jgi:hypothetical protein